VDRAISTPFRYTYAICSSRLTTISTGPSGTRFGLPAELAWRSESCLHGRQRRVEGGVAVTAAAAVSGRAVAVTAGCAVAGGDQ